MKRLTLVLFSLFVCLFTMLAQTREITGVVISIEDNEPVIGASVVVKEEPTLGAATDLDGRFKLSVPANAKTLRVSYIGMKSIEVPIQANMRIELSSDSEMMQEVVVTGMLKVDKRLFTGATTKISSDKSKMDGMGDAARALEGKAAGVSVQNISGTFGAAPKIRVRGATSIQGSSTPLWVVDGVVMDDVIDIDAGSLASGDAATLISSAIAGLNPDDIESFQVLKDGSATSIYGARAMAGVIVVTTKKGSAGVSRINYTGEYTYRLKPSYRDFNIMNSQQQMSVYLEMAQKGWLNLADLSNAPTSGVFGKMWERVNNGTLTNTLAARMAYLQADELRNTNWFGMLFNDNIMSNHSVSITNGSDKSTMYASLSVMLDPGWTRQSSVKRYTANVNTTHKLHEKLSINLLSNASLRRQKAPGTLSQATDPTTGIVSRGFDINPYSYALNTSRALDAKQFYTRNYAPFNIFHELDNNYLNLTVVDMKFQGELKWQPMRGLEFTALGDVKYSSRINNHTVTEDSNQAGAYRAMGTTTIRYTNPLLYTDPTVEFFEPISVLPQGGFANRTEYSMLGWDFRLSGSYNRLFGEKHLTNFYGGMEVNSLDRKRRSDDAPGIIYSLSGTQLLEPYYFRQLKEQGGTLTTMSSDYYRNVAFFANATYSFDGKYTLNGTMRYEGSNKMGRSTSARWLPTWNVSGAWNVDREQFFKPLSEVVNTLTLKASYSLTADRGPASVTNSSMVVLPDTKWRYPASEIVPRLYIAMSENNELTYEKKHELNLGFDASFLNGRLSAAFDWYQRNNFDIIGPVTTFGIDGNIIKQGNVAELKSSGVELSLSSVNVQTKSFRWVTDLVYAHATNEITKLNSGDTRLFNLLSGAGYSRQGYPVGAIFSIPFKGLNEEGLPTFINQNGDITVNNINFQERTKLDFLKFSGSIDPKHFGSLGNTFTYKGWGLNAFLTYSFGNVIRLDPVFSSAYDDLSAMPLEFNNRWMRPGDEATTNVPTILSRQQNYNYTQGNTYPAGVAYSAYNYSDARIAKGDFIRLKEISLSYEFPKHIAEALYLSNLSLKFQATNLFLLYADKRLNGQDPEFLNAGGVATPLPRQFTMTLRVGI